MIKTLTSKVYNSQTFKSTAIIVYYILSFETCTRICWYSNATAQSACYVGKLAHYLNPYSGGLAALIHRKSPLAKQTADDLNSTYSMPHVMMSYWNINTNVICLIKTYITLYTQF